MTFYLRKDRTWKRKSYTGILKPTVRCDSMNQAASYWSSVPHHPTFFQDWKGALVPWHPSGYATDREAVRKYNQAFAKQRDIFNGNIGTCLKRQAYNACVLPAVTYGAETWALTNQAKNKLAAAQTQMERSMLNSHAGAENKHMGKRKTKVTDVIEQVRRWKWTWAWQVSRFRDNRWTLLITTWKPYERKRPRGRPARRWRDKLDDYWKGTIWQRIAQDRQIWKQHAETFAQPRDTIAAQ